jgi:heme A synthase
VKVLRALGILSVFFGVLTVVLGFTEYYSAIKFMLGQTLGTYVLIFSPLMISLVGFEVLWGLAEIASTLQQIYSELYYEEYWYNI